MPFVSSLQGRLEHFFCTMGSAVYPPVKRRQIQNLCNVLRMQTFLKHGDALPTLLFDSALSCIIRRNEVNRGIL